MNLVPEDEHKDEMRLSGLLWASNPVGFARPLPRYAYDIPELAQILASLSPHDLKQRLEVAGFYQEETFPLICEYVLGYPPT